jgi:hypothetical protein
MQEPTHPVAINSYRIPIKAGKLTLELSQIRKVLGFAPPCPPDNTGERLDVVTRRTPTAILLVQESVNATKHAISFCFVKGTATFDPASGHSCVGSIWHPEEGVLYHLIGVAKPRDYGEACGDS